MSAYILQKACYVVTMLLVLQVHKAVCAPNTVTLATFLERTNQLMGWTHQPQPISTLYRLNDDTPDIWMYHEHFWRFGINVPHIFLGKSEDGTSHLILTPIAPGSRLGSRYWGDFDWRFLAAELREGEYPLLHGYLKVKEEQEAAGRLLKDLAMTRPATLGVNVLQIIPERYRRPLHPSALSVST